MNQSHFLPSTATGSDSLVECLGLHFANDAERRAHFSALLREKLRDPEFRAIEGFPLGSDEDILALSDPPYYTACPNPFIADFIRIYGRPYDPAERYHREPFAADVSEGKNDPIYNAHSYHTKVPHKAIMRYILHYTKPGDIVLDGFCGTGMTGVAAQMCGSPDAGFKAKIEQEWADAGWDAPEWGARRAILGDLSPAATFIAYNYNTPVDAAAFEREAKRILAEVEAECGWMYETTHSDGRKGRINYTVWSDVFVCPNCASEVVFWDVAVDKTKGAVRDEFPCPHCSVTLTKRRMDRAWVTKRDDAINATIQQAKQVPVLINYTVGKQRFEKMPEQFDFDLIDTIEATDTPYWFPNNRMPEGDESRRNDDAGITHVHHFYSKRSLQVLSKFWSISNFHIEKWLVTAVLQRSNKQHQIAISRVGGPKKDAGGKTAGHRRGTLYIPSNQVEFSVFQLLIERLKIVVNSIRSAHIKYNLMITNQSSSTLRIPDNSVDYIFIDPPFGENIMYSELNFLLESWLNIFTSNTSEVIINKTQGKSLRDYQYKIERCSQEFYRVLKPGRWITVEFHNTNNGVWGAIQEALLRSGFVITDVRTLDKQLLTHTQRTAAGSVNKDLAITAYKPNDGLEESFRLAAGSQAGVWNFVRSHLGQIPVFTSTINRQVIIINERQNYLLFDRMVAFHIQRGASVPVSASEFYAGLSQRFPERNGMYFLPDQIEEYERKRMTMREVQQLTISVSDEASAIQWIRQQLTNKPQTSGELTLEFLAELRAWTKHEKRFELRDLLEENFLVYNGVGAVPAQVVGWLRKSAELRDLIKAELESGAASEDNGALTTTNTRLLAAARDRWYVPDPNRAIDLEKVRLRGLLREFNSYTEGRGRLKVFRTEAIKAGFKDAWNRKDYALIVRVAERLPDSVVEEDADLLMYVDNARLRVE